MTSLTETSLSSLLSALSNAVESTILSVPVEANIPQDGLSLFNTKNEIFLSYLENLVFLILIKLRHYSAEQDNNKDEITSTVSFHQSVVERLAELRLYSDKGIRPLESRLKYQIDKVIRAADESTRVENSSKLPAITHNQISKRKASSFSGSSAGSKALSSDEFESNDEDTNNLTYRPNLTSLHKKPSTNVDTKHSRIEQTNEVYKPPKITPTALPTNIIDRISRSRSRPIKSAAMDDFIANELSTAPIAEPSVGSTIRAGGRFTLTARERQSNDERKRYEEENFVRLPGLTKKEKRAKGGQQKKESFGGEEWGGLNASVHRIGRLVAGRKGSTNALERSRKRVIGSLNSEQDVGKRRRID